MKPTILRRGGSPKNKTHAPFAHGPNPLKRFGASLREPRPIFKKFAPSSVALSGKALRFSQKKKWLCLKIKQEGLITQVLATIFPLRVPLWYRCFEPQPNGIAEGGFRRSLAPTPVWPLSPESHMVSPRVGAWIAAPEIPVGHT